jgi:hypothetical protein
MDFGRSVTDLASNERNSMPLIEPLESRIASATFTILSPTTTCSGHAARSHRRGHPNTFGI